MPTTATLFPTTVAGTTGSTWTTTTNATGSGTGTTSAAWAVFTNATNAGTGTISLSGYAAQPTVTSGNTIDSVVLSLRGNVAATNRWTAASCTAQLFSGTTAIGSPVAIGALSTSTSNVWTITFTGANAPTYAQLLDLRVTVTAVHTTTTSSTFNVDTAGLTITHNPPVVPSIVTDTFTRTSTTSPGTADTGQTWVSQIGTWGTDGTRLYPVTAGDGDQATIECGSTAQKVQATMGSASGVSWGITARWESTAKFYIAEIDGAGFTALKRVVGGGFATMTSTTITVTVGDVFRLEVAEEGGTGTRVNLYRNGALLLTQLDTDGSRPLTGTKGGVRQGFAGGSNRWDDFSINLPAGTATAAGSIALGGASSGQAPSATTGGTISLGGTAALASPKISTLVDDFTTLDTSKWTFAPNASVAAGQLQLSTSAVYQGATSLQRYDLVGSQIVLDMVQTANQGNGTVDTTFLLSLDANNNVSFTREGTLFYSQRMVAGVTTTLAQPAYSSANHRFLRFGESGGTVSWQTSPDGSSWTTQGTWTPTFSITGLQVELITGYYGTEPNPGSAIFESVNASAAVSASASGSISLSGAPTARAEASAAGAIALGGTATPAATATATGSISLTGTAAPRASAAASGAISLGGSSAPSAPASATGSLTLAGAPTARASAAASGTISLSGSGSGRGAASSVGTISLGGTATGTVPASSASASGTISLGGTAAGRGAATSSGGITLSGAASPQANAAISGSITLAGAASARGAAAVAGAIVLGGAAGGVGRASVGGTLTLSGTATVFAGSTVVGSISLSGTSTARVDGAATGSILLSGNAASVARSSTLGSIVLGGESVAHAVASAVGVISLNGQALGTEGLQYNPHSYGYATLTGGEVSSATLGTQLLGTVQLVSVMSSAVLHSSGVSTAVLTGTGVSSAQLTETGVSLAEVDSPVATATLQTT